MRQKIQVADLYAKALRIVPETMDGEAALPIPQVCAAAGVDELLSGP